MKTWPALSIHFAPDAPESQATARELLLAALDETHVTAVQEFDDRWLVFFRTTAERDRAAASLATAVPGVTRADAVDVEDDDWAKRSQQNLTPIHVGRIIVAPPWAVGGEARVEPADERSITIVIRPSMGFGTGHHATTRLCLDLLQRIELAGRTVLDVGTGSGVLALAAHALGARTVLAVDDDPDAIESARENLALNGVNEGIDLHLGDFRGVPAEGWDVVTANLTGGLLARSAEVLAAAVAPGGTLVISGVTRDEESDVLAAFSRWMAPVERVAEDEWIGATLSGPRPATGDSRRIS
jgi:ribosomal protein L11 methyltransferase